MVMIDLAMKAAKRLYYDAFLAPRGYGRPVPKSTWDAQYKDGVWDRVYSVHEVAHYMVAVGYVQHLLKSPKVLDAGCGPGYLLQLLNAFSLETYLGIDLSSEAVEKAKSRGIKNARFKVADFEQWTPEENFDVVIFNESLSYARRPVDVLVRYAGLLDEDGFLIVSLCRYGNHGIIWTNLEEHFAMLDSTTVENSRGQVWDIRVVQKRPVAPLHTLDTGSPV